MSAVSMTVAAQALDASVSRIKIDLIVMKTYEFLRDFLNSDLTCDGSSTSTKNALPHVAIEVSLRHIQVNQLSKRKSTEFKLFGVLVANFHLLNPQSKQYIYSILESAVPSLHFTRDFLCSLVLIPSSKHINELLCHWVRISNKANADNLSADDSILNILQGITYIQKESQTFRVIESLIDIASQYNSAACIPIAVESLILLSSTKMDKLYCIKILDYLKKFINIAITADSKNDYNRILYLIGFYENDVSVSLFAIDILIKSSLWELALPSLNRLLFSQQSSTPLSNKTSFGFICNFIRDMLQTNPFNRDYFDDLTLSDCLNNIVDEVESIQRADKASSDDDVLKRFLHDEYYFISYVSFQILPNFYKAYIAIASSNNVSKITASQMQTIMLCRTIPVNISLLIQSYNESASNEECNSLFTLVILTRSSELSKRKNLEHLCAVILIDYSRLCESLPTDLASVISFSNLLTLIALYDVSYIQQVINLVELSCPLISDTSLVLCIALITSGRGNTEQMKMDIRKRLDMITIKNSLISVKTRIHLSLYLILLAECEKYFSTEDKVEIQRILYPAILLDHILMPAAIGFSLSINRSEIPLFKDIGNLYDCLMSSNNLETTNETYLGNFVALVGFGIRYSTMYLKAEWIRIHQPVDSSLVSSTIDQAADYLQTLKASELTSELLASYLEESILSGFLGCFLPCIVSMSTSESVYISIQALRTLESFVTFSSSALIQYDSIYESIILNVSDRSYVEIVMQALSSWLAAFNPSVSHPTILIHILLKLQNQKCLQLTSDVSNEFINAPPREDNGKIYIETVLYSISDLLENERIKDPTDFICAMSFSLSFPECTPSAEMFISRALNISSCSVSRVLLRLCSLQAPDNIINKATSFIYDRAFSTEESTVASKRFMNLEQTVTQELIRTGDYKIMYLLEKLPVTKDSADLIRVSVLTMLEPSVAKFLESRADAAYDSKQLGKKRLRINKSSHNKKNVIMTAETIVGGNKVNLPKKH